MESKDEVPRYEFEDVENYSGSGGQGLSEKEIILKLFQKSLMEGAKEMSPGGVQKRFINNEVVEFPVPNQREVFINSVDMLRVGLTKRILDMNQKENATTIKKYNEAMGEIDKINQTYGDNQKQILEEYQKRMNSKIMSIKQVSIEKYNNDNKNLNDMHEMQLVQAHKRLLNSLSMLIAENDYIGVGIAT